MTFEMVNTIISTATNSSELYNTRNQSNGLLEPVSCLPSGVVGGREEKGERKDIHVVDHGFNRE